MSDLYALQLQSANSIVASKDMTRQYMCENKLVDSMGYRNTLTYRVISVENTYTLRWTGKTFTGVHKNKANLWLISAVVKGMNTKWLNHSLSIATKDIWVLKDSIQKDVITIVALKSAETGWNINTFNREYFMIDECKAPLYAVPHFYKRQCLRHLHYPIIPNCG